MSRNRRSRTCRRLAGWCSALSLVIILISACKQQPGSSTHDPVDAALQTAIINNKVRAEVPPHISAALVPALTPTLGAVVAPTVPPDERRFDISVDDVPSDQFFMSLVEGTDYNMVVHPEVTGSISLTLKNVTIPAVMEVVRDVYSFEFIRTGYGYQVLPSRLQARIYHINYLNIVRSGSSSVFVSSGTLQQGPSAGDSANQASGQDSQQDNDSSSSDNSSSRAVIGTEIRTQQPETTFWHELQVALEAIVGSGRGRSVVVSPQAGIIVVRSLPNELREVDAFLRAAQIIADRQVILEAKILEVELSDGFESGINWAALHKEFSLGQTGDEIGQGNNIATSSSRLGALSSSLDGVFSMAYVGNNFAALIDLLETQGTVHVLSSPRIATMNNQKALIKVGTDEFFVTSIRTTTVTGTATSSSPSVQLTPFFSGIALDVTPQISAEGEITLHIHPTVSEVTDQEKRISINEDFDVSLPLARSTVRESDSIVRARSGQVIIIGGLMQELRQERAAGIPMLGKVPIIGALFKQQRANRVKSELVILLRPTLVNEPKDWEGVLRNTADDASILREGPIVPLPNTPFAPRDSARPGTPPATPAAPATGY